MPDTRQAGGAWLRQFADADSRTVRGLARSVLLVGCMLFWLILLFAGPTRDTPTYAVGADLPFVYHEDKSGDMSLTEFLALPDEALEHGERPLSKGYTRSVYWLGFQVPANWFDEGTLWLKLSPNYLDRVTLYLRPGGTDDAWQVLQAGDRTGANPGDLDYRYAVFALSQPAAPGHDVVMRIQSTSAMLVEPTLWRPTELFDHAVRDTALWSFYFGLGVLSSALALLLAVGSRSRLLWSAVPFSVTYLLVASVQGYVGWSSAEWRMTLQHYLTGTMSLLGYPSLLWMCAEALDLRLRFPRLYRATLAIVVLSLLLPLSIPLGLYGHAVRILAVIGIVTGLGIAVCSVLLWWRWGLSHLNLAFGILPMFYVVTGMLAVMITTATIRYDAGLYALWQYSMMLIMMTTMLLVMTVGVYRIRRERRLHHERQQLARELRLEREASFHQRQFIGMVSHEFRTPLAVISGTLENLNQHAAADAQVRRRYEKIQRATNRLVQLTDNCLADARLAADKLYLDQRPVELFGLIRHAAALVEFSDEHRLHVSLDGRPVQPDAAPELQIAADEALLRIALSNLLDNAVKYSPHGEVNVAVRREPQRIVVAVEDQGPGIPAGQAEQVFDRYRQGSRAEAAERGGSGLGLFVARQIARAHGGDLILAANTAQGCHFELILTTTSAAETRT